MPTNLGGWNIDLKNYFIDRLKPVRESPDSLKFDTLARDLWFIILLLNGPALNFTAQWQSSFNYFKKTLRVSFSDITIVLISFENIYTLFFAARIRDARGKRLNL